MVNDISEWDVITALIEISTICYWRIEKLEVNSDCKR